MKNTALTHKHISLGAKMVPFAGYNMPVSYAGIRQEHNTVRNGVGVFDVSHMGEFWLTGKDALSLVQHITSNDASKLYNGKVQYSCMPNGKGGIVDDLLVYRIADEEYMLVVNASNMEKDWNWIAQHNQWNVGLENRSDDYSLLAVQGPKAAQALQSLTSVDLADMEYYTFLVADFAGFDDIIISATGYTGAGGFEIYFRNEHALAIWDAIFAAGQAHDIAPIGLGARDTLRLEMGFCLYGHDINDSTSPLEAGLGWITKLDKVEDFIDKSFLVQQKASGVTRRLVGFEMIDRGIPRQHYAIVNDDLEVIGEVTSGSESPSTGKLIGMGYVEKAHAKTGTTINILVREKPIKAMVVKTPFI